LPASEIAAQINASQTHLNINCSEETVWIRPSRLNCCKETTTKGHQWEEKPCWAMKHKQLTLDRWKSVLWSDESKLDIFGSNRHVFVRCRVGELEDLRMCGSHREAWRRRCEGALLVTLSVNYLEVRAHFTRLATTAVCSETPSHLVWA
jgi:hypothetical protein